MARTMRDQVIDKLLSSYIINEYNHRYSGYLSETKLQKLIFLSEKNMIDNRIKAFNYNYIKFYHGPFSSSLRNDLGTFAEVSLIQEPYLNSSEKLQWIIEDFKNTFKNNEIVLRVIHSVLRRYAEISTKRLLKIIYSMPWSRGRTIGDLPLKTKMLYPLKAEKANYIFNISEEDYEDLAFCFDKNLVQISNRAAADLREGRIFSYDEPLR